MATHQVCFGREVGLGTPPGPCTTRECMTRLQLKVRMSKAFFPQPTTFPYLHADSALTLTHHPCPRCWCCTRTLSNCQRSDLDTAVFSASSLSSGSLHLNPTFMHKSSLPTQHLKLYPSFLFASRYFFLLDKLILCVC